MPKRHPPLNRRHPRENTSTNATNWSKIRGRTIKAARRWSNQKASVSPQMLPKSIIDKEKQHLFDRGLPVFAPLDSPPSGDILFPA
jgi:hypothetical protein